MPPTKQRELDLTEFPPGTVTEYTTLVCLACIFDIFTKQLNLAPRTAFSEIKRHTPTIAELTSRGAMRPYFDSDEKHPHCPYCGSSKRWLARFDTYCIEGGKTTDAARRARDVEQEFGLGDRRRCLHQDRGANAGGGQQRPRVIQPH
jgi:hypothetical protein